MAESLGTVKTGTYGVADLFVEQRKYDKDKAKFFIWRERGHAAMVNVLITKLPKVAVTDPEPKHFEDGYRKFAFTTTVTAGSTSGTLRNIIYLADADAAQLQAGDTLKVKGGAANWINIDSTGTTATYGARSATYSTEEIIKIKSVGASDGTNTPITVRRAIGASTEPSAPVTIADGVELIHSGEASEDGSGSRRPFSQNAVVVNNFIQIFQSSYTITDIAAKTDIFGENEWQRKARNARKDFARRLDRAFKWGKKYSETGADNEMIWYTGGVDEWIPNDSSHRINAGRPMSQTYIASALSDVFMEGSEQKFGFCDYDFITKLANTASDKIRYNEKLSNDIGWDCHSFSCPGGGTLHLVPDFEMSVGGRSGECYIEDIAYLQYMYMQGEDIHIDKGNTGKGLQLPDEKKTKHQIYGVVGLKRSYKDAHFQLYGFS